MVPTKRRRLIMLFCCSSVLAQAAPLPDDYTQLLRQRDYASATQLLEPLVAAGEPEALYALAQLYRNGLGVKADPEQARYLLEQAAEKGHRDSQYLLGLFYSKGIGGATDPELAKALLKQASDQGHPQAVNALKALQKQPINTAVRPEQLVEAARKGHLAQLKNAGKQALQQRDPIGNSLLAVALQNAQLTSADWLRKQGLSVNTRNPRGETALHLAILAREQASIDWLLKHGVKVNAANRAGKTALHWAVAQSDIALCRKLLAAGADASLADKEGRSALGMAQARNANDVLTLFKAYGFKNPPQSEVQLSFQNSSIPPLQLAVERNNLPLLKSLLNKSKSPWQPNSQGHTLVTLAAQYADPEMLDYLLQHSPDRALIGPRKRNALFFALLSGSKAKMMRLLAHGVDATQSDEDGSTIVDFAIETESPLSLAALKAIPENQWQARWLPIAASQGMFNLVQALIISDIDINVEDTPGRTALYYAAVNGQLDIVEALIRHQANADLNDPSGNTLLHAVAATPHREVLLRLLEHGDMASTRDPLNAQQRSPLHIAAGAGQAGQVQALIEAGADINLKDANGNTPLILSVLAQDKTSMDLLLKAKAEPNKRNANKQNALDIARQLGYEEMIHSLEESANASGLFSIFQ